MSVSYGIDADGRVIFSGVPAGSTITKNGVEVATGVTGAWTDNRPQKNYKTVATSATSYSFTGVEFCIRGTMAVGNMDWVATVDGVPYAVKCDFRGKRGGATADRILWGISGLANTTHTVVITKSSGTYNLSNLSGYSYSDISVPFGDPVTYNIAGTDYVVSPRPDRLAATQSRVSRWIASYGDGVAFCNSFGPGGNSYLNEYIAGVAGAYEMTGDSRLPAIGLQMLNRLAAISDPDTGLLSYAYGNDLLDNGRTGFSLWYAYKVFGDVAYLDAAAKIVAFFLSGWERDALGRWFDWAVDGSEIYTSGNQRTAPCLGCALMYNEPNPAGRNYGLYQNAALRTLALNNATYALSNNGGIQADGSINYATSEPYPNRLYGMFEWMHLRYLRDHLGFTAANIDLVDGWHNGLPMGEPYFWIDSIYGSEAAEWSSLRMITDPAVTEDYKDLFFSAAFSELAYSPTGFDASTAPISADMVDGGLFYSAQYFKMLGVELPVTAPVPTGTLFTDAAGNQSPMYDSNGNPVTFYDGNGNAL